MFNKLLKKKFNQEENDFMIFKKLKMQFWSLDIVFAIVIFGIVLTILLYIWFSVNSNLTAAYSNLNMILQTQNYQLSQNLLTPGVPNTWQSSINTTNALTWNGITIGLATSQRNINFSVSKIYALMAMANYNYSYTKQILGLSYNYYIVITGASLNLSIGKNPKLNNALTINIEQKSIFIEGTPATLKTIVWTD